MFLLVLAKLGQNFEDWPKLIDAVQALTDLASIDQHLANTGQFWSNLVSLWSVYAFVSPNWPMCAEFGPNFGRRRRHTCLQGAVCSLAAML